MPLSLHLIQQFAQWFYLVVKILYIIIMKSSASGASVPPAQTSEFCFAGKKLPSYATEFELTDVDELWTRLRQCGTLAATLDDDIIVAAV